ncbi:MFS transporter, partial [Mesorhizobium sp. M8A.F.Ca.ET.181.01.1.1]
FHVAPATALLANCVATLCLTIGSVMAGSIAGRVGAGRTIFVGGLLLAVTYYAMFQQLAVDTSSLVPLYGAAGLFVGVIGAIPFVMVKAFPPV